MVFQISKKITTMIKKVKLTFSRNLASIIPIFQKL
jgi:hypothetical protein